MESITLELGSSSLKYSSIEVNPNKNSLLLNLMYDYYKIETFYFYFTINRHFYSTTNINSAENDWWIYIHIYFLLIGFEKSFIEDEGLNLTQNISVDWEAFLFTHSHWISTFIISFNKHSETMHLTWIISTRWIKTGKIYQ